MKSAVFAFFCVGLFLVSLSSFAQEDDSSSSESAPATESQPAPESEPQAVEQQVEPTPTEPQAVEQQVEPTPTEPQAVEQQVESTPIEPQAVEQSQPDQPAFVDESTRESQETEQSAADPETIALNKETKELVRETAVDIDNLESLSKETVDDKLEKLHDLKGKLAGQSGSDVDMINIQIQTLTDRKHELENQEIARQEKIEKEERLAAEKEASEKVDTFVDDQPSTIRDQDFTPVPIQSVVQTQDFHQSQTDSTSSEPIREQAQSDPDIIRSTDTSDKSEVSSEDQVITRGPDFVSSPTSATTTTPTPVVSTFEAPQVKERPSSEVSQVTEPTIQPTSTLADTQEELKKNEAELAAKEQELAKASASVSETYKSQVEVDEEIKKNREEHLRRIAENPNADVKDLQEQRAELDKKRLDLQEKRKDEDSLLAKATKDRDEKAEVRDQTHAELSKKTDVHNEKLQTEVKAEAAAKIAKHTAEGNAIREDIKKEEIRQAEIAKKAAAAEAERKAAIEKFATDDTETRRLLGRAPVPAGFSAAREPAAAKPKEPYKPSLTEQAGNIIVGATVGAVDGAIDYAKGFFGKKGPEGAGSSMAAEGFTTEREDTSFRPVEKKSDEVVDKDKPPEKGFLSRAFDSTVETGKNVVGFLTTGESYKDMATNGVNIYVDPIKNGAKHLDTLAKGCTGTECTDATVGLAVNGAETALNFAPTAGAIKGAAATSRLVRSAGAVDEVVAGTALVTKEVGAGADVVSAIRSGETAGAGVTRAGVREAGAVEAAAVERTTPALQSANREVAAVERAAPVSRQADDVAAATARTEAPAVKLADEDIAYARQFDQQAQQEARDLLAPKPGAGSVEVGGQKLNFGETISDGRTASVVKAATDETGKGFVVKQYPAGDKLGAREEALTEFYRKNGIDVPEAKYYPDKNIVVKEFIPGTDAASHNLFLQNQSMASKAVKDDLSRQYEATAAKIRDLQSSPEMIELNKKLGRQGFTDIKPSNFRYVADPKTGKMRVVLIDP